MCITLSNLWRFMWRFSLWAFALSMAEANGVGAESQSKSDPKEKAIQKKLIALKKAKVRYEEGKHSAIAEMAATFDRAIEQVQAIPGVAIDLQLQIVSELRKAKQVFETGFEFTRIPAFQGNYVAFVRKLRSSYDSLMAAYKSLLLQLTKQDSRREKFEKEIDAYYKDLSRFDSLKPGKKFVGYRSDIKLGPRLEINPKKIGTIDMFRKVEDRPVNIDFTLKIDSREDRRVVGTITQNGGRFAAEVQGTYDGIQLKLCMTRMKAGPRRYFEYVGEVVGAGGVLRLQGVKTNGVPTAGVVMLSLQSGGT